MNESLLYDDTERDEAVLGPAGGMVPMRAMSSPAQPSLLAAALAAPAARFPPSSQRTRAEPSLVPSGSWSSSAGQSMHATSAATHATAAASSSSAQASSGGLRARPRRASHDADMSAYTSLDGAPPPLVRQPSNLSASFLSRVPRSMRQGAALKPTNILMSPLLPPQQEEHYPYPISEGSSGTHSRRLSQDGTVDGTERLPHPASGGDHVESSLKAGAYSAEGTHVLVLPGVGAQHARREQSLAEIAHEVRMRQDVLERASLEPGLALSPSPSPAPSDEHAALPALEDSVASVVSGGGGGGWYSTGTLSPNRMLDDYHARPAESLKSAQAAADERRVVEIFLEEMGSSLISCGLPLHVVEFYITCVAQRLKLDISFAAIGTTFWLCYRPSSVSHMIVVRSSVLSLSKLVDTCAVSEKILRGQCSPVEGLAQLQSITRRQPIWPMWMQIPTMGVCCFFYGVLFSGGWVECGVSALIGLVIGAFEQYSAQRTNLARGHDLLAGAFAAGIAMLFHSYVTPINLLAATFGGIVWCLPGLRITMAMLDLSTGHPVTATSKFFTTMLTAINLGIGVVAGISLGKLTGNADVDVLNSLSYGEVPSWFVHVAVILSCFPMIVLLDAHRSHALQYIAGACLAYYTSNIGAVHIGQAFGAWLAAGAVGLISALYGRVSGYPSIELALFSILMLVPGSIGVRSVLASDTLSTVSFIGQMLTVAIAIVTGLFTANVLVPPVRAL